MKRRSRLRAEDAIGFVGAGLGTAAALAVALDRPPAGAALALGAGLSVLNYLWLKAGAGAMLRAARGGGVAWSAMLRFWLRFGLLGLCIYAIFISHLVPFAWVLAGLFAVPAATLLVGMHQLVTVR